MLTIQTITNVQKNGGGKNPYKKAQSKPIIHKCTAQSSNTIHERNSMRTKEETIKVEELGGREKPQTNHIMVKLK